MKDTERKRKRGPSKALIVVCALLFMTVLGLCVLRFQVFHLERILSELERRIEGYSTEESSLRRDFSALSSPSQIYDYWKNMLGMEQVRQDQIHRIRVFQDNTPDSSLADSSLLPTHDREWRLRFFSFLGMN